MDKKSEGRRKLLRVHMAIKGRIWQIDNRGFLINDAKIDYIKPPFQAVVDDVVEAYQQHIGDEIHSIYMTGSIPRGLAVHGKSDLDAIALLEYYTEPELVMQDWIAPTEQEITSKHDCISDVQMEIWPHGWVLHDPSEFSISAFILQTYAVCVWGADITPDLTKYKFTDKQTRLAIANDDIVQIEPDIQEAVAEIEADSSSENVSYWCKRICKNMIHTAFSLVMVDEAVHTRDIDVSVAYFLKHYPDYQSEIQQITNYIVSPTESAQNILDFLDTFGSQLITEGDHWLDEHNPDRYLEFQFE